MRMVPLRRELGIEIFMIIKILSKLFKMLKNTFSSLFRNPVNHNFSEKFDFFFMVSVKNYQKKKYTLNFG